jgi:hypothetical protein
MRRLRDTIIGVIGPMVVLVFCPTPGAAQSPKYRGTRTKDGRPDLSGIWQTLNTANWDLVAHAAQAGHAVALGAQNAEPGGVGVVEGGEIPYLPSALARKKENYEKRFTDDPEIKCYMPGVPRATYLPFPFQILQSQKVIHIAYEFAASARTIFMDKVPPAEINSWMGQSEGPLGGRHAGGQCD